MEEKKREATEQRPVHNVQGDGYSIWYDLRKSYRSAVNKSKKQVKTVCWTNRKVYEVEDWLQKVLKDSQIMLGKKKK